MSVEEIFILHNSSGTMILQQRFIPETTIDAFFLEYHNNHKGDFISHIKNQVVIIGLITFALN